MPEPLPEAGFTLVELLVVTPVLLIVTGLVLSTLISAYGAESSVQSASQASSQVTLAFMELDGEIRYAADINVPGSYNSNYYVEWESDWTQNTQNEPTCTQLEYNNASGALQQRSWLENASAPATWQVLASGLKTSISTDPFSLSAPSGSPWQLSVSLTSVMGSGASQGTAQSSFTVTSLDTTSSSSDGTGSEPAVCGGTP